MSTERAKGCWRGLNPDEQIEAALRDGLSEDRSGIDSNPVHRELAPSTKPRYAAMMEVWKAYERKYPDSDPRNMEDMKHFAEAVGRSTPGRLDKVTKRATVASVRNKIRKFMSQWQRETNLPIPKEVHDSMAPYIKNELRHKIPLSIEEKAPTFLTIENYVDMEELLWQHDHHNYVHEGCRVDLSALLKMHCYTSARLQEICKAKYKDLVCMVAWKDGEPDIKISFKREFTKGMQDTPKKPKHPLYERLKPAPPLSANGLLFLLAIIISAGAFRDYSTLEDVLAARPPRRRKYQIMTWADSALDDPVFPEMSADGATKKTKNETAWGDQCSDWAKRADFTGGMGLHAARREILIKVDDGGYSLGQVMKFAAHRNSKTLVGHYLDDMSNVDGAATFLGLEPRRDLTEDFRSASMRRNPDLRHSLPARNLDELKHRQDFIDLCEQIEDLSTQITTAITEEARKELKAQRRHIYDQRQTLINEELENYHRTQRRVDTTQCEIDDQGEWHRSYFDRVVRHMVPERDRLARTLLLAVPLRSPEGISALRDLIALRTNDSPVAYQEVLRPIGDRCAVPTCRLKIKDISVKDRWKHVYRCSKDYHEKQSGFAEFCFRCSRWITSEIDWEAHCQGHINNLDLPFRCDPVTFRHAVACTGYCSGCLGKEWLPAALRMKQFLDRPSWQRHISECIPKYVESLDSRDSIKCPHFLCSAVLHSQSDLWHHLGDIHSTQKPDAGKKRQRQRGERVETSGAAEGKRPRLQSTPKGRSEDNKPKRPRLQGKRDATTLGPIPDLDGCYEVESELSNDRLHEALVNHSVTDLTILTTTACTITTESGISTPLSSLFNDTLDNIDPLLLKSAPAADAPPRALVHGVINVDDLDIGEQKSLTQSGGIAESMAELRVDEYPLPASIWAIPGIDPPAAVDTDDRQFIVERLVGERVRRVGKRKIVQYLVKWEGYPENENTWEDETDVHDDLIKAFAEQKSLYVSK